METGRAEGASSPQPDGAALAFWSSELLHEVISHTLCYVLSGHSPGISDSILNFFQGNRALTYIWAPTEDLTLAMASC